MRRVPTSSGGDWNEWLAVERAHGQNTIPKAIRERLGLEEGSVLEFVADETGRIFLRPREDDGTDGVLGALREFAPRQPITVDEMKAVVKARAARKVRGKTR